MKKQSQQKPNFFMVGAMKAGTTALFQILKDHPQIYFPKVKEPHYFISPGTPVNYYGKGDQQIVDDIFKFSLENYLDLYRESESSKINGDGSAMYLYIESSCSAIQKFDPKAKILIVLRNPVARAYSSYLHLVRDDRETESFERALELEEERIADGFNPIWHYKKASLYADSVARFMDAFDEVKIIIYEEYLADPSKGLAEICEFLDIESYDFDTSKRYNVSGVPKNKWVHNLLKKPMLIKRVFRGLVPYEVRESLRNKFINKNLQKPAKMSIQVQSDLYEYFRSDIRDLENLLGKSLDVWKNE